MKKSLIKFFLTDKYTLLDIAICALAANLLFSNVSFWVVIGFLLVSSVIIVLLEKRFDESK